MSSPQPAGEESARGPSLLLPSLVAVVGVALTVHQLVELLHAVPLEGRARPMNGLVLASALALGGFSLTRLVQLMLFATDRRRRASAGEELPGVPWQLTGTHALHGVWVIGVGASIGLMGLLGVWSLLDGRPSGLEPGWPLLVIGGAVSATGRAAWLRTSAAWEGTGEGL
jgi:hypothetical protein